MPQTDQLFEDFYKLLKEDGSNVQLHDPYISYWEEQKCEVETNLDSAFNEGLDIIIISTGHSLYKNNDTLSRIMNLNDLMIYDTVGLFSKEQIEELMTKNTLSVLGRGDI